MGLRSLPAIAALLVALVGCDADDERTYTLYRESAAPAPNRIHVATFDAKENEEYNRYNCEKARELFQAQPSVRIRYWCEKGRYRE
jgi:hypothetical protein